MVYVVVVQVFKIILKNNLTGNCGVPSGIEKIRKFWQ